MNEPTKELTALDRCDSCGARAYIRATFNDGRDLVLCGHHGYRHEDKLRPLVAEWDDQTHQLQEAKPDYAVEVPRPAQV